MSAVLCMTLTLLATTSSPEGGVTLTGTESRHLGVLVAQAEPPPPPLPPPEGRYDGWSHDQLRTELRRLNDLRPSLGAPIVLICIGSTLAVIGLTFAGAAMFVAAVVFLVPGAALVVLGAMMLNWRIRERRELDPEIEIIEEQLQRPGPAFEAPRSVDSVLPMRPQLVLARF